MLWANALREVFPKPLDAAARPSSDTALQDGQVVCGNAAVFVRTSAAGRLQYVPHVSPSAGRFLGCSALHNRLWSRRLRTFSVVRNTTPNGFSGCMAFSSCFNESFSSCRGSTATQEAHTWNSAYRSVHRPTLLATSHVHRM